jgi:hypothetical protein
MKITFTNSFDVDMSEFEPQPASKFIPLWYKKTSSYVGSEEKKPENGLTTATIKRCMPVFDAITAGYIITTYTDIYVKQEKQEYADEKIKEETGKDHFLTEEEIEKQGLTKTYPEIGRASCRERV